MEYLFYYRTGFIGCQEGGKRHAESQSRGWNTRYVTPDGFVCQLTLRGDTGKDLLEKAKTALSWLKENGYLPSEFNGYRSRSNNAKPEVKNQPSNGNCSHGESENPAPRLNQRDQQDPLNRFPLLSTIKTIKVLDINEMGNLRNHFPYGLIEN